MTLGQERWLLHAPGGRFVVAWPVYVGEERSEVGPVPTDGDLSGWALAGWGGEGWEVVTRLRPRNGLPCADCPHSLGQHAGGASSVPGAGCEVGDCACAGWRPSDDTHLELALLARLGVVGRCHP